MKHYAVITKNPGGGYVIRVYNPGQQGIKGDLWVDGSFVYTLSGARRWARRTIALYNEERDPFREIVGDEPPKPLNLGLVKVNWK